MLSPAAPAAEFNEDEITPEEIATAVKKARSKSSPSPFDVVPYVVFKKCPTLLLLFTTSSICVGHFPRSLLPGSLQQSSSLVNLQQQLIHLCQATLGQLPLPPASGSYSPPSSVIDG